MNAKGSVGGGGGGGGVLVVWDKRSLVLLDKEVGPHLISCCFKNTIDGFIWVFTGVYGPLSSGERNLLWDELGAIRGLWKDPWCIGGDFNIIRFPSERNRLGRLNRSGGGGGGGGGGALVVWDKRSLVLLDKEVGPHSISTFFGMN